jgi:hypothetical protein
MRTADSRSRTGADAGLDHYAASAAGLATQRASASRHEGSANPNVVSNRAVASTP